MVVPVCRTEVMLILTAIAPSLDGAPVLAFGPRMVCTGFGMIGGDARPNSISTEQLPLVLEVGLRLSDDPALLFELGLVDFAAR